MPGITKYASTEVANLAFAQAGSDILPSNSDIHYPGGGKCEESIASHTTEILCDNENGSADPHTYSAGNIGHFKGAAKQWVNVTILGDGISTITLTPWIGDTVTITASEQDSLIGVGISGTWKSVISGGSGSKLLCIRG